MAVCDYYKIQRRTNVPAIQQSEQYKRHRPETTLLYQLIERYYPSFTVNLAEQGKYLPKYVDREFDEFLRYGRLEYGFSLHAGVFANADEPAKTRKTVPLHQPPSG